MPVSQQLQQGILDLIYFTWLHNAEALAYFAGVVLMIFLLFKQPKRVFIILLLGFISLLIQFEYVKHIIEPLMEQTLQTVLQTGAQATKFQKILNFFLQKAVPVGLYLFGWGSVFLGIFLMAKSPKPLTKKPELKE